MEINEYRPKHSRLHKASSEYEASQAKGQNIRVSRQDYKPVQINKNEQTIVKGEIIDLRYQDVKIKLEPSGQIISARISGELPLSIGQTAEFVISDQTDGQITLKYISSSNAPLDDIIQKALFASGYTASERNIAIVQELLNYQMPVDKKTILQLIKLTSTYPDVNIPTLVLMHKHDLPINNASIAQFETYQKGSHQILNQLNSLIDQLSDLGTNQPMVAKNQIDTNNMKAFTSIASNKVIPDDIPNKTPSGNTQFNHIINMQRELLNILIDGQELQEQLYPDTAVEQILPDKELIQLKNLLLNITKEEEHYSIELRNYIKEELSNESMTLESLLTIVHDLYQQDSLQPFSGNTMLPIYISRTFISMYKHLSEANKEKLVNILYSDDYTYMIAEALHKRWTLSPNELKVNNRAKEFYSRLDEDMERLDELTDSYKMVNLDNIKSSVNKLQDNLQFMRYLNELFIYLQLPIRFKEQDVHGDLYVFTRKNHKHDDTERLNVLLHLDMTYLGSMDIHMFMSSRQVNAVFYLEKSSEQLISKYLHELTKLLSDKGYQFQAKTQISDNKTDFINNILEQDTPSAGISRYSFDIRA
ncbi:MAG: hypothetical protein GX271_02140 [Clostridiales bacterium]|nr:hypothetical protein [Clostridiales bacterium]